MDTALEIQIEETPDRTGAAGPFQGTVQVTAAAQGECLSLALHWSCPEAGQAPSDGAGSSEQILARRVKWEALEVCTYPFTFKPGESRKACAGGWYVRAAAHMTGEFQPMVTEWRPVVAVAKPAPETADEPTLGEPADVSGLQLKIEFDRADRTYHLGEKWISGTLTVTADQAYQVARVGVLHEWRRRSGAETETGGTRSDTLAKYVTWRAGEPYTYRFDFARSSGPTTQHEGEHSLEWYLRPVVELEGKAAPAYLEDRMRAAEESFVLQEAIPTQPSGTPIPASPPMQRSYGSATQAKVTAPVVAALGERRLGALDIVSVTWGIFTRHWWIVCLLVLAQFAFGLVAGFVGAFAFGFLFLADSMVSAALASLVYGVLLLGGIYLISALGNAMVANIVEDDLTGRGRRYVKALTRSLARAPALVLTGLLAFLILFFLSLLLIIPGIVWSLYYAFGTCAVVLRGLSGKKALDYSKSLVEGRWWGIFWLEFGLGLVFLSIYVLLTLTLGRAGPGLIYSFLTSLLLPLVMVSQAVLFLNLDTLRHGQKAAGGEMQPILTDTTIQAAVVPAHSRPAAEWMMQPAAMKHRFKVGEIYRNRQGQYEVVKIDDVRGSMIIRYLGNEGEFETSIELQSRIWQSMSREDQSAAKTSATEETTTEPGDTAAHMAGEYQPTVTD